MLRWPFKRKKPDRAQSTREAEKVNVDWDSEPGTLVTRGTKGKVELTLNLQHSFLLFTREGTSVPKPASPSPFHPFELKSSLKDKAHQPLHPFHGHFSLPENKFNGFSVLHTLYA